MRGDRLAMGTPERTLDEHERLELPPGEVHIWLCRPEEARDPSLLGQYDRLLDSSERARLERFVFERERVSFLVSHALLRTTLSAYAPPAPEAWRFSQNEHGRPELLDGDRSERIRFNLSHTTDLVACAVTREWDLGVDVECLDRDCDVTAIAGRYFSVSERDDVLSRGGAEQRRRFFDYWTLKEAYAKAVGRGLSLPFDAFGFRLEEGTSPVACFSPRWEDDPTAWWFLSTAPSEYHRLALAVRKGPGGPSPRVRMFSAVPLVVRSVIRADGPARTINSMGA